MLKEEKLRILIAGSGGQGVLTLGRVISYACMKRDLNVSCLPAYGAEMRGGYVYCIITLSNSEEIFSPVSSECDIGIFMNEKSFHILSPYIKKDGIIILNSSLIEIKGNKYLKVPATEEAENIGDIRVTNMIFAGFLIPFIKNSADEFGKQDIFYGIEKVIKDEKMKKLSKRAVETGYNFSK